MNGRMVNKVCAFFYTLLVLLLFTTGLTNTVHLNSCEWREGEAGTGGKDKNLGGYSFQKDLPKLKKSSRKFYIIHP